MVGRYGLFQRVAVPHARPPPVQVFSAKIVEKKIMPKPDKKEINTFVYAARDGDQAAVIAFLNKYDALFINEKSDISNYTALTRAVMEGNTDIVRLLLE